MPRAAMTEGALRAFSPALVTPPLRFGSLTVNELAFCGLRYRLPLNAQGRP